MSTKRCAFLTMANPEGFFAYDHLAVNPLNHLGWDVELIPWNRPTVNWNDFDVVVIRSPWDYQKDPDHFLRVLELIQRSRAWLQNPLESVRWNIHKSYLRDMQQRGVSIVPTLWLEGLDEETLPRRFQQLDARQIVIKPVIGANADDTFRLRAHAPRHECQATCNVFRRREVMVQPFVDSIVEIGEYSLFYFGGQYSHCVLKTPRNGDFRVQEEHGGQIRSCHPEADLLDAGRRAIAALDWQLLYARVDLARLRDGTAALIELELIEPSLYFPFDPASPRRFAECLDRMYASRHG